MKIAKVIKPETKLHEIEEESEEDTFRAKVALVLAKFRDALDTYERVANDSLARDILLEQVRESLKEAGDATGAPEESVKFSEMVKEFTKQGHF